MLLGQNQIMNLLLELEELLVFRVAGVNADSRHNHVELFVYFPLDFSHESIQFRGVHGIRHLDMGGSQVGIRTIVMEEKVIGAENPGNGIDGFLNLFGELAVRSGSQNLGKGFL